MLRLAMAVALMMQAGGGGSARPPALVPTGPWNVLSEPTMCTMSRDYDGVSFAISSMPVAGDVEMAFVGTKVTRARFGDTAVFFGPAQVRADARYRGNSLKGDRRAVLWFRIGDSTIAAAEKSDTLWIDGGGATVPPVRIAGFDRALRALRDCEKTIAAGLGIDMAEMEKVVTPAKERMKPNFIPPRDYPKDAIDASAAGEARVLWMIGADGRVSDCRVVRSAGFPALDHATCAGVEQHARYDPAKDAQGRPVRSWRTARVKWALRMM